MSSCTTAITRQTHGEQKRSPTVSSFQAELIGSTTTNDPPESVIPVESVESVDIAEHRLRSYLGLANSLYDLRLRIPEAILYSKPVENILRSILKQKRRFAYDRETSILRVYSMSRPIHDAISHLVTDFCFKALKTGFIADKEEQYILCGDTSALLSRSGFRAGQNTKKRQAWIKYPDATIMFGHRTSKKLPSVVFEVGFTEGYDDLVGDAAQWLQKSSGKVRLVVLVNIKEDVQSRRVRMGSDEAQKRIQELIIRFGTNKVEDREEIDCEGSDLESDADLYDEIEAAIMVEDWVGPIVAKLEVWHMVNGTPKRRQGPITVLPRPQIPRNPTIYITDIVPEEAQASFEDFDKSRSMELNMDSYRGLLSSATCALAHMRAVGHIRPREDEDGEYID